MMLIYILENTDLKIDFGGIPAFHRRKKLLVQRQPHSLVPRGKTQVKTPGVGFGCSG